MTAPLIEALEATLDGVRDAHDALAVGELHEAVECARLAEDALRDGIVRTRAATNGNGNGGPPENLNALDRSIWFADRLRDRGVDPATIHPDDWPAAYHGNAMSRRDPRTGVLLDAPVVPAVPFSIAVYSARDLAALELPEPAETIAGPFVRKAMATLIGGLTGHGKTTWIAHLLKAAVIGGEFLGYDVRGGARILVLDLEQHLASIQRVIREAGLDDEDAIDYAPLPEGLALDKRADQLAEIERLLAEPPAYDIVVIDPFYKLHEADSNDELQARLLVALLRRWINQHGFALVTATHCRKLPAGRTSIGLDDLYGSSLFTRDPETILGIQRHGDITKLHVFKSREPGLDVGQLFELLFTRDRGYYLKPTVDPEERATRLNDIGIAALEWVADNPRQSTNAIKKAVGKAQKCGGDLVEEALRLQVKSGLLPAPLEGSRGAKLWYPLNHAALTSPETLLGEVTESGARGQDGDDLTRPPDLYVVEREGAGEVVEAELERLTQKHADLAHGATT